ncbi:MAG TPA: hypothetical protein VFX28_17320, partial [Methylomirabilota bacterium]|nr:hypothetical protein [Methylomirabilota bacterium]
MTTAGKRVALCLALALGLAAAAAWGADQVVVEDWTGYKVGTRGLPPGWKGQSWGKPAYDFEVVDNDGHRV